VEIERAHRALALPRDNVLATDGPQAEPRKIRQPPDCRTWTGWAWMERRWEKVAGPGSAAQIGRRLAAARKRLKLPASLCCLTRGTVPAAPPAKK
jgi:hypothetical protein